MCAMAWDNYLKSVKLRKNANYVHNDQNYVHRESDKHGENCLAPRCMIFTDFMLQIIVSN